MATLDTHAIARTLPDANRLDAPADAITAVVRIAVERATGEPSPLNEGEGKGHGREQDSCEHAG